jgi:putative ABC transport system permease protein
VKYAGLVWRNLGRNKLRSAFTAGAITLAVLLVCLLLTMPNGLDALIRDATSNTRLSVHHKAGLVYSMPASFTRKVRALEGVEAAMGQVWFGGAFEEDGKVTFPNFAAEAEHFGAVFPEWPISEAALADFQRYRDGAIVGRQTAEKYGWRVGQRITLRSTVWPVSADVRIVGIIGEQRIPSLYIRREYLDEALKAATGNGLGTVGVIWVRVASPELAGTIMQQIDEMSRNSEAESATETEKSFISNFFGSLQGLARIILLVTGLVTLCIVFIAGNTASMSVRERAAEIATMKAMGFGRRVLFGTLLAETILLSAVAGGLGVSLAFGLTRLLQTFATWSDGLGPLGNFYLTEDVVLQGLGLSLVIGVVAGLVPALSASRKPVVEALREVF